MGGDSQSGSACSPHILLFERLYPLGLRVPFVLG